ncbi:MAG: VOC family protein [Propioniciclava sp.]|uniref:VOC family protein n=1 Tax=Propioniciclava sp. TaxID=2038686 RepID=UPI0039E7040D
MPAAPFAHFAINADDPEASKRFYAAVFGFEFDAWGPPGFFHIRDAAARVPLFAALQARRDFADGRRVVGFEVTFAVDDVDAAAAAAQANGGEVLSERTTIDGVGDLVWLADPSGNPVGAIRYLADER